MSADILFSESTWDTNLVFGGSGGGTTDTEVTVSGTLEGVSSGAVEVNYDNAVARVVGPFSGIRHQDAERVGPSVAASHASATYRDHTHDARHQVADRLFASRALPYQQLPHRRVDLIVRHQDATPTPRRIEAAHKSLSPVSRITRALRAQQAAPEGMALGVLWGDYQRFSRAFVGILYQHATPRHKRPEITSGATSRRYTDRLLEWEEGADRFGWGYRTPYTPPVTPPEEVCYEPPPAGTAPIVFFDEHVHLGSAELLFYCPGDIGDFIPTRRSYVVRHTFSIVRVSDSAEIPATGLQLQSDADAWAWTVRLTLAGPDAVGLLEEPGGGPALLEATVDGWTWRFIVESWSESREFGRRGVSATGRSLTAYLDLPYAAPRDYTEASAHTVGQLADQELPFGWTLDWSAEDWLVGAGAWSYTGLTPIRAISACANAAGGIVIPSRVSQTVTVAPRYSVYPWNYGSQPVSLTIPEAALSRVETRFSPDTWVNGVYVQGGETDGILARVYLDGTAGDQLAQAVVDRLITHTDGARALGGRIVAGNYQQPETRQVTLPLDDGTYFPLVSVGDFIEVMGERTIVSGVAVSVDRGNGGALRVRQSLNLGEDSGNVWSKFTQRVLPADPLLVGEVTAVYTPTGEVLVQLSGGGSVRVRGEASLGDKVYIRSGRVDGPAPNLTAYDLVLY